MQHLIGYRLTLAEVASRRVFQRHIGTPFKLRPVEFTILVLLLGNGSATPKQLAQTLGAVATERHRARSTGWSSARCCSASAATPTAAR